MNDEKTSVQGADLEFEYEFNEPPDKVWRAISIKEFRDNWLPPEDLADPEEASVTPGREVCYRMREAAPPFLESTVTFRIAPNSTGGTNLQIIHELDRKRRQRVVSAAANSNIPPLMLAA